MIGFVDENPKLRGKDFAGLPVLGNFDSLLEFKKIAVVIAVRNPNEKVDLVKRMHYHPSLNFPNLFSSSAWVSRDCIFGKGNLILPGSLINFGTMIGNFNSIDQNCSIGHESVISNYCSLDESVTIGGYTFLEDESKIGREATVSQGVRIGRETEIDAGAQVQVDLLPESHVRNDSKPTT